MFDTGNNLFISLSWIGVLYYQRSFPIISYYYYYNTGEVKLLVSYLFYDFANI